MWSVESTRWPVSAALSAVWTVSSSRISPIRIVSGSWRRTRRRARLNDAVSAPTSRWLMIELRSRCRNSIGSSIVTMCLAIVRFMWSSIAASVVDLPEPVVPVSRMIPRSSSASLRDDLGQAELVDRLDHHRDRAHDDRDRAALAEGVDAEAAEALDRVGEVDLVLGLELLDLARCRRASRASARSVSSGYSRSVSGIGSSWPCRRMSGYEGTFRCRSEPSAAMR